MAKKKADALVYTCTQCNNTQPKWLGRCPECGEWNSFVEKRANEALLPTTKAHAIPLKALSSEDGKRYQTGIAEFDIVLGGGLVKRSCSLIGGEPGIGKSTLLLQVSARFPGKVLYVSGEESASQIKSRANRLSIFEDNIEVLCTRLLEDVLEALASINPVLLIVDSIQTLFSPPMGPVPGTVNQLKYCANELIRWVKERDSVLFLTAHITKDGGIAGPKALEHMVDTVVFFERNDDRTRFLRSSKNRYGSVDELGIFSMTEKGLVPVEDPASLFLTKRREKLPAGVAIVPVFEGSRVFLVEIQALTVPAKGSLSRVYSDKVDSARISRIAAVLEKRLGLCFSDQDLYINVAGGVRLTESAIDLALAMALFSARSDKAIAEKTVFVGELSLAGEVRPVDRLQQRIKASQALGFTRLVAPDFEGAKKLDAVHPISQIREGIDLFFAK